MKNTLKAVRLLLLVVLVAGCKSRQQLPPVGYVQYLENPEHAFCKEIRSGDMQYTIQLATPEYMAAKELAGDNLQIADSAFTTRLKELQGYTWLVIHIADKKGQNPQTQEKMVMYYEQPASADLKLQCGGTELMSASYHFENNYGLTPYNTIVAAFATGENTKDHAVEMTFNDRFQQQPLLKAQFDTKDLPQIRIH